eukprot:CAMPEP_0197450842 /NCGR_PEP_ID=MMETSP1175-20131217/26733_1 /TAXON_ID=1003142 /ORGANISM="Triceratium dubium, Strain CCMP147" /LENGTH=41 /DNA_ID= /DNA_START= /DNA_END= /DNA_ORIENTATION=
MHSLRDHEGDRDQEGACMGVWAMATGRPGEAAAATAAATAA